MLWPQRSSAQAGLPGETPARMASAGYSQRGRCCHLYIGPAAVTCLESAVLRSSGLADRLPLVTASRGPGGRLRNVSAAGVSQRSQARRSAPLCQEAAALAVD